MKPVIVTFVGGYWDGKSLRTNSADQEEALLAAACFELSHHGAIGAECPGLSADAVTFARVHGWDAAQESGWLGSHRYLVTERDETEKEITITFQHVPVGASRQQRVC